VKLSKLKLSLRLDLAAWDLLLAYILVPSAIAASGINLHSRDCRNCGRYRCVANNYSFRKAFLSGLLPLLVFLHSIALGLFR